MVQEVVGSNPIDHPRLARVDVHSADHPRVYALRLHFSGIEIIFSGQRDLFHFHTHFGLKELLGGWI